MHGSEPIQAVKEAKNDLIERLQHVPPGWWLVPLAEFVDRVVRSGIGDPQSRLMVIQDVMTEISRMTRNRFPHTPDTNPPQGVGDWLLEAHTHATGSSPSPAASVFDAARVNHFVENHLEERLTLEKLAEEFGYSSRHFSRAYKRATGFTVHEYIARERIRRSAELIRQGEKVEVAMLQVGYRNKTHFSQTFQKFAGCRPGEYVRRTTTSQERRRRPPSMPVQPRGCSSRIHLKRSS